MSTLPEDRLQHHDDATRRRATFSSVLPWIRRLGLLICGAALVALVFVSQRSQYGDEVMSEPEETYINRILPEYVVTVKAIDAEAGIALSPIVMTPSESGSGLVLRTNAVKKYLMMSHFHEWVDAGDRELVVTATGYSSNIFHTKGTANLRAVLHFLGEDE
jgi:hypothetical protein